MARVEAAKEELLAGPALAALVEDAARGWRAIVRTWPASVRGGGLDRGAARPGTLALAGRRGATPGARPLAQARVTELVERHHERIADSSRTECARSGPRGRCG